MTVAVEIAAIVEWMQAAGRAWESALDAHALRSRVDALTQASLASTSVGGIAQQICRLANLTIASLPGTPQFSQTIPCFTITQGESWWHALKRLGNVYDFDITTGTPPSVKLTE